MVTADESLMSALKYRFVESGVTLRCASSRKAFKNILSSEKVSAVILDSSHVKGILGLDAEEARLDSEHPAFPESASQEELVAAAREYLRARFAEPVSLAELAARFHVNPPYLTRVFKRYGGVAPVRYVRDRAPDVSVPPISSPIGSSFAMIFPGPTM